METEVRENGETRDENGQREATGEAEDAWHGAGGDGPGAAVGCEDLPPEFCRYRDEGCELAGSCLDCPFPACVDESPGGRQAWRRESRNARIAGTYAGGGATVKELAAMFGVSRRTVQRALREHRLREGAAGDE